MANGMLSRAGSAPSTGEMDRGETPSPAERQPGYAAGAPQDEGQDSNVSPEEQAQYDRFVSNGLNMIFDQKTAPMILNRIKSSPNPVEGLAATTVMVVERLKESAAQKGMELSPDVLLHGGIELMGNIAELAKAAKLHEFSEDEIENASYAALDLYATQEDQRGTLDKESIAQDFQTMMAADREGRIDEVLPGITEMAQRVGGKGRGRDEGSA